MKKYICYVFSLFVSLSALNSVFAEFQIHPLDPILDSKNDYTTVIAENLSDKKAKYQVSVLEKTDKKNNKGDYVYSVAKDIKVAPVAFEHVVGKPKQTIKIWTDNKQLASKEKDSYMLAIKELPEREKNDKKTKVDVNTEFRTPLLVNYTQK